MARKILVGASVGLATLAGLVIVTLAVRSAMAKRPDNLGLVDGRLRPCPDSPNCVCSEAADAGHRLEPLRFDGSAADAMRRIKDIVAGMPRAAIVTADDDYLHAEFTSLVFRFVDDVEFAVDPQARQIQMRSASRTGYSDLGVNRRRLETIRAAFGEPQ